jgi:hypothetical protein
MAEQRLDPVQRAKHREEREKLLLEGAKGRVFSQLDSRYDDLDHQYDRARAALDQEYSHVEQRMGLIEQGRALRSGQERANAKAEVAAAKNAAKAAKERGTPTTVLEDLYQPIDPRGGSGNPAQIPVTSIGAGGPQGVQQMAGGVGASQGIPDYLVSGRLQQETGPEELITGVNQPVTRTTATTDIEQNAPTADAMVRAQALLERARYTTGVAQSTARAERVGQMLAAGQGDPRVALLGQAMLQSLPPEEQQMAVEFAGSFQGKEATGTSRVRLQGPNGTPQLVPGYMAKPGAQGFDDVPRTNVSMTNIMPGVPTMAARTAIQGDMRATSATADSLNSALQGFRPEFLTLQKQWVDVPIAKLREKVTGRPEEDANLRAYADWAASTSRFLTDYIKEKTGAQFSNKEAERLLDGIPNMNDSISSYAGKVDSVMRELRMATIRNALMLHDGFGDATIKNILDSTQVQVGPDGSVDVSGILDRMPRNEAYLNSVLNREHARKRDEFQAQGMDPRAAAQAADAWVQSPEGFGLGNLPTMPPALEQYLP